ncbi:LAG1 longevity assurance homolog 2 [Zea mays]|uniref:LAG1 longevity assurance homolog 2 n=1 Tax=Zea mays TaxID=4577 RepID=A0A1D6JX39_MAIZE|nr:LAG1 longevity assurance homolog 2 [Zea mays]
MSSGSGSFGRAVPGYASEDPSLPKPWRGLVDGITGYLYYWNPDTNVMHYHSITFWRKLDEFPTALYYIFNTMLLTLLVFHMYWWKLICLMIMRQLNNKGQVTDDVRSDSEDDE